MSGDIYTGVVLLCAGMMTVFAVLSLIVLFGNILIRLVNKYFPASETAVPGSAEATAAIRPEKLAVIAAAADIVTRGRGRAVFAKKIK